MKNQNMKFYYSPLSIGAFLLICWGIWILIAILRGAYPTYFVFIFPSVGIGLLILDNYIRKSKLDIRNKLLIQLASLVLILFVGYLLFKG